MPFTLLLQSVFYDRPRMNREVRSLVRDEASLLSFIGGLPQTDPFRAEAFLRVKRQARLLDQMRKHEIQWVDIEHANYPSQFHQLHDPPFGIFYRGNASLLKLKGLGLVGSRKASVMAPYRIESMMRSIRDYAIISGGALGVDALVHREALACGLPTVAVLASGLDHMVPLTNRALFQKIISSGHGCILSECPPGVRPRPYFFPQRNRLIAALSHKLIVIEAAKRSGALLTANLALGMSADVAAMVGAYDSPQSEGCYQLMNDGAMVIGNHNDLCEFLGLNPSTAGRSATVDQSLVQFLAEVPMEPIHIDDLAFKLSMSIDKIIEYVTLLSLNGDVVISSGQMVSRRV
jgi:DNA processing protein